MKVAVITSPIINLSHTFFSDYHDLLGGLANFNDLFLVGSTDSTSYTRDCLFFRYSYKDNTLKHFFESRYSIIASNVIPGYRFVRSRLSSSGDRAMAKHISAFIEKHNVDVVYSFPWYPESYLTAVKQTGKPLVVEFMEDQICFRYGGLARIISKEHAIKEAGRGYVWLKSIIGIADHIIVPSVVFKERLIRFGAIENKVSVVPVCTHPLCSKNPDEVRLRFNIPVQKKVIYYLGSLSWYHDLRNLLRAINEIKRNDIVLIVSGGWKGALQKYASVLEKSNTQVIYTGVISNEDLDNFLALADVCVGTYEFDYPCGFFPGTIVRYMLAGKPIVATDLPEIREMFRGSYAGLLVKQGSYRQIAKALEFLLDNENECFSLGTKAQEIAYNTYLWKHHSEQVNQIIKNVVNAVG